MISKLKKGDEVEIIAPSSFIEDEKAFFLGIDILRDWGLKVNHNNIINRKYKSFSGTDEIRLKEVERAQNSKLIIFAKGGWGSARLLEENIEWGKGWMLGFSDTCSLLLAKYKKGMLGSIHGPMITTLAKEPSWSIERLRDFLFEGNLDDIQGTPLKNGIANGEILVSNLTIISFLVGTEHLPSLKDKILILEDINEDIYKIDRMFTYLKLSKKFENISGIGFGNFVQGTEEKKKFEQLIIERFEESQIPIVFNLPIGHITGNACMPIGFKGTLNGYNGKLSTNIRVQ